MGRRRTRDKHLPPRVYRKHGAYFFARADNGKWIRLGATLQEALAAYARLVESPCRVATVGDLLDRYLKEVATAKAPRTYKDNVAEAGPLRAFFGSMFLDEVRSADVYRYLQIRGAKAPVRARREKALLSHCYTKAIEWGLTDRNPCAGMRLKQPKPRDRCPSWEEVKAFADHAGPFLRTYIALKVALGLRQADMLALRLDQLKEDGIHAKTRKDGKKIVYEWTPELEAVVKACKALRRPAFDRPTKGGKALVRGLTLFCTRDGQPYTGNGFRSIWQRAMRSALRAGVLAERFTEHDLRALAGTEAERQGINPQDLLAHASAATTRRYLRDKAPRRVKPVTPRC